MYSFTITSMVTRNRGASHGRRILPSGLESAVWEEEPRKHRDADRHRSYPWSHESISCSWGCQGRQPFSMAFIIQFVQNKERFGYLGKWYAGCVLECGFTIWT